MNMNVRHEATKAINYVIFKQRKKLRKAKLQILLHVDEGTLWTHNDRALIITKGPCF